VTDRRRADDQSGQNDWNRGHERSGLGELDRLYVDFASSLELIVRAEVQTSEVVIEDACQAAWTRLVHHRQRIPEEAARGWLTRTAVHEALKLCRRELREAPAEAGVDDRCKEAARPGAPGPQQLMEQRQRLLFLTCLPQRQQRLVWLRALGFSYQEMAAREGCTSRTVERQLERARRRLRLLEGGGEHMRSAA
jgi:RNA polymerase sigma factor (sigma-70 family)